MGLPRRPFLYTIDQIADLVGISEQRLKVEYLHFTGRTIGKIRWDMLQAIQIAPCSCGREEWRVEEEELIRWLKRAGMRIYE